jgi:hypothetical protein
MKLNQPQEYKVLILVASILVIAAGILSAMK